MQIYGPLVVENHLVWCPLSSQMKKSGRIIILNWKFLKVSKTFKLRKYEFFCYLSGNNYKYVDQPTPFPVFLRYFSISIRHSYGN